jgi:hypothetical protein
MSDQPPQVVIDAIEDGTSNVTRRVEFYLKDGTTLWIPEGPDPDNASPLGRLLPGGSISIDSTRDERRMFDCTFDNSDGAMRPHPTGFWYDKIIKFYRGVVYDSLGTIWECQVGEMLVDSIQYDNFPHTIAVSGRDYTKRMLLSKIQNSLSVDAATKLHDLVKALASNSGITAEKLTRMPTDSPALGAQLDVERGTDRWSIAKDATDAKGYELYFDAEGYLIMELYADPALGAVEFTFKTGPQGNLNSYERSTNDSELYNHIIVVSEAQGDAGIPYFGEAKNTEPSSPTSIDAIGDRLNMLTLASAGSDDDCKKFAKSVLKVSALESYELSCGSFVYPWLDAGIVTKVLEPDRIAGDPTRFLLSSLELPLDLNPMNVTAKRLTIVGEPDTTPTDVDEPPVTEDPGGDDPGVDPPEGPPEPPTTSGPFEDVRIATYNLGAAQNTDRTAASLHRVSQDADIIGCQEGASGLKAINKFLNEHPAWGCSGFLGNDDKRAVVIFYRKSLGTVTRRVAYLEHKGQFVGNRGVTPHIRNKYCVRVDIKLAQTNRTIGVFNNHLLPSWTRNRSALGADEYNKRRNFGSAQINVLTNKVHAANVLAFGTGDFNATPDFPLLNPLWSEIGGQGNMDHNFATDGSRTIDFVWHRSHAGVSVQSTQQISALSSDHDCAVVTYRIKKA